MTAAEKFDEELLALLGAIHISASGRRFTDGQRAAIQDLISDLRRSLLEVVAEEVRQNSVGRIW